MVFDDALRETSFAASALGTNVQTIAIARSSDSSLRFIAFIKYPSFLM